MNMYCKYCEPYREEWVEGTNGDAVVTKYAELVAFPDTDFEVAAVHIPIRYCPFCGRPMK